MTYSIVARDPVTGEIAVGSESHFFGVGRLVGWLRPGIGGVATQSFVNVDYGPQGLDLIETGSSPEEALHALVSADPLSAYRQAGIVDSLGRSATFTGDRCVPSAAGVSADGVTVQGNMLTSDDVVHAALDVFRSTSGHISRRVLAAMRAAEDAGGDARGSQSAVLKVVSGSRSETPWRESVVDIRVDDHPDPISELERLVDVDRAFGVVGGILFTPGLMIGAYRDVPDSELESALADLAAAEGLLGENMEAAFWRGVLLARANRRTEADALFTSVFARSPQLDAYLDKVIAAGFLPGR